MEIIFSTTTKQIATSVPGLINNIIIEPQKIILTQIPEGFFDKQWVIALIGAVSGVVLSVLFSLIKNVIHNKIKIKTIARGFFIDIVTNRSTNNRDIQPTKDVLAQFQRMSDANSFTSHPSIQYAHRDLLKYYNSQLSELKSFDHAVGLALYAFYNYVDSVIATTKLLDDKFKRFYRNDTTVGAQDVINSMKKKIRQMEIVDASGVVILALLVNKYKVSSINKTKEIEEAKERINNILDSANSGQTIELEQISQQCRADILLVATIVLKRKDFKDDEIGKYKKT
ncbi:hypothetical protein KAI92_02800 [Candidatus Parcubacteria bacterium]|nr:hypothetical protein [Candidatus Parcubacteria bacterium]